MTLWNAGLLFLIFFSQIEPILAEKNGNNKRIECLSNDCTILISVLLCLCKEFQLHPPPGNPQENFFERANPGHPGNFFV